MVSLLLVSHYHSTRTYRFPHKLTIRYISGAYHSDLPLFLPLWITVLWYFAILYEVFSVNVKCLPSLINQAFPPLPSPYFSWRTPSVRLQPERYRTSNNNSPAHSQNLPRESDDPAPVFWIPPGGVSCVLPLPPLWLSLPKVPVSWNGSRNRLQDSRRLWQA